MKTSFGIIVDSIIKPHSYKKMSHLDLWKVIIAFVLFSSLIAVLSGYAMYSAGERVTDYLKRDLPNFHFTGTTLEAQQTSPRILFQNIDTKAVIDTSSDQPKALLDDVQSGIVFAKDTFYIKDRGIVQDIQYTEIYLPSFTKDELINTFEGTFIIVTVIWKTLGIVMKLLFVFPFSLLALIIANISRVQIPYTTLWKITAFALIPAFSISTLNAYIHSGWLSLAFWVATWLYLYTAVHQFQESERSGGPYV